MLVEIIIYITLFAALFSGAFTATFQTVDSLRYLQVQKNKIDDLYLLQSKLNSLVQSSSDWRIISESSVRQLVLGSDLSIESFSLQILETVTSSSRVLFLTIGFNKKIYTFSYVQEK